MNVSIKKVFSHIRILMVVITLLLGLLSYNVYERSVSFSKIDKLQSIKAKSNEIAHLDYDDLDLSIIQFHGTYNIMKIELSKLKSLRNADRIGSMFFEYMPVYDQDLAQLSTLMRDFESAAEDYYSNVKAKLKERKANLEKANSALAYKINSMIIKNSAYEKKKFALEIYLTLFTFLVVLLATLWYSRQLKNIYRDIESLFSVDTDGSKDKTVYTQEVEVINKRMSRKPSLEESPDLIDPVTEINNYKGLLQVYANMKSKNEHNFVAVCLFEIDYFKELDEKYPKEFIQTVLKKIAFIISLNKQHHDVVGRCDKAQFCVVFSRNSKEQAYKDCETIRNTIADTVFKVPRGEALKLTVSGGFTIKPGNKTLAQAIEQAKEIVVTAQENGRNRIAQLRDHAEKF